VEDHGDGDGLRDRGARPGSFDQLQTELVDHLAELVVVVDESGCIVWFNAPAEETLGWRCGDWVGRSIVEMLHPEDGPRAVELLVSARASGPGSKEPVRCRIAWVVTGGRRSMWLPGWLSWPTVASSSSQARVAVRGRLPAIGASEVDARVSTAFERAIVAMGQVALSGRILRVNAKFADALASTAADLRGLSLAGLVKADDRRLLIDGLTRCVHTGNAVEVSIRLERDQSASRVNLSVVRNWMDEPLYVLVQISGIAGDRDLVTGP
jgi:PAS domain-containing protein